MPRFIDRYEFSGRLLACVPREVVPEGFYDLDREDHKAGKAEDEYLKSVQEFQLMLIQDVWEDNGKVQDTGLLNKK